MLTGRDPRAGSGEEARPLGPAPTALPARAWRGAAAVGEGRGRAGPGRPSAPLPRRAPATPDDRGLSPRRARRRAAAAEGDGGVPNKAGEPRPPTPRAQANGPGSGKGRRSSAHRERGLSGAAARRPRMGAERDGGGDWPERFPPGRPRRGVCPGPRLPRCRHSLTWRPPPPGRAGGASAEQREPDPSAALSVEGNNRPERRLRPHNGPPPRPAPSRPPTAPIGHNAPFESWVAARYWLPRDGAVLPPEARRLPAPVRGRAGRLGPLTAAGG